MFEGEKIPEPKRDRSRDEKKVKARVEYFDGALRFGLQCIENEDEAQRFILNWRVLTDQASRHVADDQSREELQIALEGAISLMTLHTRVDNISRDVDAARKMILALAEKYNFKLPESF